MGSAQETVQVRKTKGSKAEPASGWYSDPEQGRGCSAQSKWKEPRVHQNTKTLSLDTREAESEDESKSSSTSKVLGNKGYGREQVLSSPDLERDNDLERWFPPREG